MQRFSVQLACDLQAVANLETTNCGGCVRILLSGGLAIIETLLF
jgi:hypothetical protein